MFNLPVCNNMTEREEIKIKKEVEVKVETGEERTEKQRYKEVRDRTFFLVQTKP